MKEPQNLEDIAKGRNTYLKLYNITKQDKEVYDKKKYNVRMTPRDKRRVEGKFQFRGGGFQIKYLLIMLIMVFLILLLADTNLERKSMGLVLIYLLMFSMLFIAMKYNVNSYFYWVFFVIFIVVFLNTKNFNFINWKGLEMDNKKMNNIKNK